MHDRTPRFFAATAPDKWDDLSLLASTIYLEAEDQGDTGMLAVGWVIRNRVVGWKQTWNQVITAPFQFSCWNADERVHGQQRLERAEDPAREAAWKAAASAYWGLAPDPTKGATFYLNVELTKKIRGGTLPKWAADPTDATKVDPAKVTVGIMDHQFLRA